MDDDDYLNLAGIQHFMFCRRQWALIHIEQQWEENIRTVEGNIFHENAHDGMARELRKNKLIVRRLPIASRKMKINGVCDVVEFIKDKDGAILHGMSDRWIPIPVEYKKGRPKADDCDVLQLVAQAVCLEEMLLCKIEKGYLFYGEDRHRTEVNISDDLRQKLYSMTEEMHKYYKRRYTPKVKISKKCKACSLSEICMPVLCKERSAKEYIMRRLRDVTNENNS